MLFLADINSNLPISVISIQETWSHEGIDMTAFSLLNYAMVYENRRLTVHGGLIIYRNNSNSTRPLIIAAPLYGAISLCLIASNSCRTEKLHCCHGNLNCHHTVWSCTS